MENDNQNQIDQQPTLAPTPLPANKGFNYKGVLAGVFLAIVAAAGVWFYFNWNQTKNLKPQADRQKSTNTPVESPTPASAFPVPAEWKNYHQDVLGLSISYPPKWGDVTTAPSNSITDLKTVVKDYQGDNGYNNTLTVNFAQAKPKTSIYNQQYPGEKYNNVYAWPLGYIDNFSTLKQTKNICSYKIDFQHQSYPDTLKEIYSDCQNGVKIAVIENMQHFNPANFSPSTMPASGILYTYNLNYYGYKNLQNGSFDFLLTTYTATGTKQQTLQLTAEEFFKQTNIKASAYPNLSDFTTFVQNLKSFTPPIVTTPAFETPAGEDSNITLIRRYYYLLTSGQFSQAYQLLANSAVTQDKFVEESKTKIYQAKPRDFKKIAENKFEFWVDYQEQNKDPRQQRVIATIVNGKIKVDFEDTLTSTLTRFGNMLAYGASRGDKSIVLLKEGDKETIPDSAPNDFDKTLETLIFHSANFSPQGNYLLYGARGYEWSYLEIYDIKNKKLALKTGGGDGIFNSTDTLYFFCNKNDMGGDYNAKVYQAPEFTVKLDLLKKFPELKDYQNVSCTVNSKNNSLQANFTGKYDKNQNYIETASQTYNITLDTGELVN